MSLPCCTDGAMGISAIGSAGAIGSLFEPTTALVGIAIAAVCYGITKIIKSIKGTKYELPKVNTNELHNFMHKQQKTKESKNKKSDPSNNGDKEPKKQSPINNMKEYFSIELGKKIEKGLRKTKKIFHGQSIYRATKNIKDTPIRKGDYIYLDGFHKDHFELFDRTGKFKTAMDFSGKRIIDKARPLSRRINL